MVWFQFVSADQFNRPIRKAAALMSNYTSVYFYEFGYQGTVSADGEREYDGKLSEQGSLQQLTVHFWQVLVMQKMSATTLWLLPTTQQLISKFRRRWFFCGQTLPNMGMNPTDVGDQPPNCF